MARRLPLVFRLTATDWLDGGIEVDDAVSTACLLNLVGVEMIDCSSAGISRKESPPRMKIEQGFQTPFAEQIRSEAGIGTIAVGFLWDARVCDEVIALDVSRFDAAPLVAFIAAKQTNYGTETDRRIPR